MSDVNEQPGGGEEILQVDAEQILGALNDGVYVTDIERRIIYWSPSAERITGWPAEHMIGRRCCDDLLGHVDKDHHRLCGEEHCPLHRAIQTGQASMYPVTIFAKDPDGRRIPVQASVAPLRNDAGQIIGGVEAFRDFSALMNDFERARQIQDLSRTVELPQDPRVRFAAHYMPHDIVGGDYFAVNRLDENRFAILLADVTGHGVAAALYTMHLSSLWQRHHGLAATPAKLMTALNAGLCDLVKDEESFATALGGVIDLEANVVRLAGAGNPPPLRFGATGGCTEIDCSGLPLGYMRGLEFTEQQTPLLPGDVLLLYTDAAVDVKNSRREHLNVDGFCRLLEGLGYPGKKPDFPAISAGLLRYSDGIRLEDDLTLLDIRRV
jgi:PAS domain S-box-containing protein